MPHSLNLLYPSEPFHSIPDWCPSVLEDSQAHVHRVRPAFSLPLAQLHLISAPGREVVFPSAPRRLRGMERSQKEGVQSKKALQTVTNYQARRRGVVFSLISKSPNFLAAQIFKFCLFQIFNQIHKENENCEIINKNSLNFPYIEFNYKFKTHF